MIEKVIDDEITVTTKGTFTLPVKIRRILGITEKGAKLKIRFYTDSQQAVISKPLDFLEIQEATQKYVAKGLEPLTDVSKFYQTRGDKQTPIEDSKTRKVNSLKPRGKSKK